MDPRRFFFRAALLATAASVPLTAGAQAPPSSAGTGDAVRVLLDQAAYWRSKFNAQRADDALALVLTLDPRNADALALQAQAAADRGNQVVAKATLAKLQAVRPDDPRISAISRALQTPSLEQSALADARDLAVASRPAEALAAYHRVFKGDAPPPGLAPEYYNALGQVPDKWAAARDSLAAQLRSNPQDFRGQIAYAQLLTYHAGTREQGIARLRRLAENPATADDATKELQQVTAVPLAEPGPLPAVATAALSPQKQSATVPDDIKPPVSSPMALYRPINSVVSSSIEPYGVEEGTAARSRPKPRPARPETVSRAPEPTSPSASSGVTATDALPAAPVIREYERYAQVDPGAPVLSPGFTGLDTPPSSGAGAAPSLGPAFSAGGTGAPAAPSFDNPFRSTSAPTLNEPAPSISGSNDVRTAPLAVAADPITADIDRNIQQINQTLAPVLQGSLSLRGRSGDQGLSHLYDVEAPLEASFSPNGYGRLKVQVTPAFLAAGTPSSASSQLFGTNPLAAGGTIPQIHSQRAGGAALDVGYAYGPVSVDVGSTPLGFQETNVVGGIQYAPRLYDNIVLRITGERRAVTDSLLSYAGTKDPRTGLGWGGVTRNRGYAQLEDQIGNISVYAGAGAGLLTGNRVRNNTEIEAGAGVNLPVWTTPTMEVRSGLNLVYFGFNRNLDNFTLGQGGYFSPQSFFAALIPVTFRHQVTPDLVYTLGGSVGVQAFRSKSEDIFPANGDLQSQLVTLAQTNSSVQTRFGGSHELGPAGGASAEVDYRVNDRLHVGARVGFDRAGTFTEGTGLVYARYVFTDFN